MIPIKDDNATRTWPVMTVLLIAANVGLFIFQLTLGDQAQAFIYRLGTIPWEITHFREAPGLPPVYDTAFPNFLTLFTSMFLHGGVLHLFGNMLYLWVFGDNVEALTGHFRFILFYVICGMAATITHVAMDPSSTVPMVGASGAISGILGAYFIRFPRAKVHILLIFFFIIRVFKVSALFVLGFWFLLQLCSALDMQGLGSGGGVAWFAHIGGFVAGVILIFFFERKEHVRVYRRQGWWW